MVESNGNTGKSGAQSIWFDQRDDLPEIGIDGRLNEVEFEKGVESRGIKQGSFAQWASRIGKGECAKLLRGDAPDI
ncbi:hypothetical protein N7478_003633 [Penicillium angulare]|uniref:uncharacterized protein n=1 Tax=Penicillium angulare TaxID=116970 RepID=UPI00253FF36A|nr:uncharacterized protein N7478_003633 [Penicillium angulare]KAJ5287947.1 hypothetical protein N7478_003633 [Penicillium angulare]